MLIKLFWHCTDKKLVFDHTCPSFSLSSGQHGNVAKTVRTSRAGNAAETSPADVKAVTRERFL